MAKSMPTLNLVSRSAASSLTAPSSSASSRLGILRALSQKGSNLIAQCAGKPAAGGSNQNDEASSSQVWLTDSTLSERARKVAAVDTNQDQSFPERARKLAAEKFRYQRRGRLEVAAQSPHISCQRATPRKSLLELATATQAQARRQNGGSRYEYVDIW